MARRRRNQPELSLPLPVLAVVGLLVGGGGGWLATMPAQERASVAEHVSEQAEQGMALLKPEPRPYRNFGGCNDARAAGYENIMRDEPSYREDMDGDHDGIACEPYR